MRRASIILYIIRSAGFQPADERKLEVFAVKPSAKLGAFGATRRKSFASEFTECCRKNFQNFILSRIL
jgi:hypothetical protein